MLFSNPLVTPRSSIYNVRVQRNKMRMQCVLTNEVLLLVEPEKLLRRSAQYRIELTQIFNVNRRVGRARVCARTHADVRQTR
jgi:hypothetical protein